MIANIHWPALWAFVVAIPLVWLAAGWMKLQGWVREGDARKLCHAAALVGGGLWFCRLGPSAARPTFLAAGSILFAILLAVCMGKSHWPLSWMFRGYARSSDAPHEAWHVWTSWLVSLGSLATMDWLFRDLMLTRTAILVLGIADGVAEPVGTRWGRHRYQVPDLHGAPASRSLEGSLAVGLASFATVLLFHPAPGDAAGFALAAAVIGLCVAVTEAITPHGLDNLTIPLVCSLQLHLLL
jgi:phytol kinase